MNLIWFLLPLAMTLSGFFLWLFLRSVQNGQFDHLDYTQSLPLDDEK